MQRMSVGVSALVVVLAAGAAATDDWEFLGPSTDRVLSIALAATDPDRLYAVTGDGVHHTADGGRTWELRLEHTESYVVVADPSTAASAYVAAGCFDLDATCGVHVTRDGGSTWSLRGRSEFFAPGGGPLLAVPTRPTTLYASTRDEVGGGLAASEDAGETWETRHPTRLSFLFTALVADPFHTATLVAGINDDYYRGVGLSGDGGRSWSLDAIGLPPGIVTALAYDHRRAGVVYAGLRRDVGFGGLHRSDDGGRSWREVDAALATTTVEDVIVDPADSNRLYLATDSGVSLSDAGGSCARPLGSELAPGAVEDIEIEPTGGGYLYAATTAGVFRIRPPARPAALTPAARTCRAVAGRTARRLAHLRATIECAPGSGVAATARLRALTRRSRARMATACRGVAPADLGFPEAASLVAWLAGVIDAYRNSFDDLPVPCPDHGATDAAMRAVAVRDLSRAHRTLAWCLTGDGPAHGRSPARPAACAARLARSTSIPAAALAIRALVWDACERLAALETSS